MPLAMFELDMGFSVLVLDFQFKCKMCWSASWDNLRVCQGRRQVIFELDIGFLVLVLDFQFKCKMCWSASWDSLQVCQGGRQVIF